MSKPVIEKLQMSLGEARKEFSAILCKAAYAKAEIVVTRHGKPLAVIVNIEEYEKLKKQQGQRKP